MTQTFADTVLAAIASKRKMQPPDFFYDSPKQARATHQVLKRDILRSKRYILDDDVTAAAVDLGLQHPEILLAVLKNAFTPFESIWLEWSPAAQILAAQGNYPNYSEEFAPPPPPDRMSGALVTRTGDSRFKITNVSRAGLYSESGEELADQVGVSPLAIEYDLHSPLYAGIANETEQFIDRYTSWSPRVIRNALLAGSYFADVEYDLGEEDLSEGEIQIRLGQIKQERFRQCDHLSAHAQWVFDPVHGKVFRDRIVGADLSDSEKSRLYQHARASIDSMVQEQAGVFRFIISVLALMVGRDRIISNNPNRREKSSRIIRGKSIGFVEARRVSLVVPRKIANKRILRILSKSIPRAQHDVEGHWKQRRSNYDVNCDHVMVWETPRREVCAIKDCGYKRWRVDDFKRGDPNIGVIEKTRVVKLDRKVAPLPTNYNAPHYGN